MKPLKSADQTAIRILVLLMMLAITGHWAVLFHRYKDIVLKMTLLEQEQKRWMPLVTRMQFKERDTWLIQHPTRQRRVVLMGDSIFQYWDPPFRMPDAPIDIVNRGASGEKTQDMLNRFADDVLSVRAFAVILNGGSNDIKAGLPIRVAVNHLHTMAIQAHSRGVRVVLATLPPLEGHQAEVEVLNRWIRSYAAANRYAVLDYHAALGGYHHPFVRINYKDSIHPTPSGYAVMAQMTHDLLLKLL